MPKAFEIAPGYSDVKRLNVTLRFVLSDLCPSCVKCLGILCFSYKQNNPCLPGGLLQEVDEEGEEPRAGRVVAGDKAAAAVEEVKSHNRGLEE